MQYQVDILKRVTQSAILAAFLLILIITMFFLLYEIVGYISTDFFMSNDEGLIEEKVDRGKIIRFIISVVVFGLSFLVFIGQICNRFSSND